MTITEPRQFTVSGIDAAAPWDDTTASIRRALRHGEIRRSRSDLRRRVARSRPVRGAAGDRQHRDPADEVDLPRHPGPLRGHGHRHRGADGHRPGAGGWSRHRPPQPVDRGAGQRGRQGQALRVGHDRRAGDAATRGARARGAGGHGAVSHLWRADHRRLRPAGGYPHQPRSPLCRRRRAAGQRA